jgi:hypothetical protein
MVWIAVLTSALGTRWGREMSITTTLAAEQGRRSILLDDNQGYTRGPFTAFMAPFNNGGLIAGTDYMERLELDPGQFTANSQISWSWPAAHVYAPIRGFLAIDYGNYANTTPEVPIRSGRVSDIRSLSGSYKLDISGTTSGFDVIIDFFLTSIPASKALNFDDLIKDEVEIFLHTPHYAKVYADSVPFLGTFTSASGMTWNVSRDPEAAHGPDILFYPSDQSDVLAAAIDIKAMLSWLERRHVIAGSEYFNGLALGVEPQQLDGKLTVNDFRVHYEPSDRQHP